MNKRQLLAGGLLAIPVFAVWYLTKDSWQAAGAVATAEASIVALVSAMGAIDFERKKHAQERKDRDAQAAAARNVARAMLLNELQVVLAAALRLSDNLPGHFEGQIEAVTRTAQEILDHRFPQLLRALNELKNPITPSLAPLLQSLPQKDLAALKEIMLLIGNIQRTPLEIQRRLGSRSGVSMTATDLIGELNVDNGRLIDALLALRNSWQPNLDVREMRKVV